MPPPHAPWTLAPPALLDALATRREGLTVAEAARRLREHGRNELHERARTTRLRILGRQLKSPLLLLLVFASAVSIATGDWIDAVIVLAIVFASAGVGGTREWRAEKAAALLQERIRVRAEVLRGGTKVSVPVGEVVPGDVVVLRAGSLVPADGVLLEADDLHVNEAVLTGESFPARKQVGALPEATPIARRRCCVHQGTNVRSGNGACVVVATGGDTAFGAIAERLTLRPPETEFDRGLRRFGALLTTSMFVMVLVVFTAHVLRDRPPIETLLFAIALAVGLSPELLPAVLSVNLARGADAMAARGVLVRRLAAIENLGSMDVLCTDKTGTLTVGVVHVGEACDARGVASGEVLDAAALNAALSTGLPSPLDDALLEARPTAPADLEKRGEIPFDFVRKRVSVIVASGERARIVTKGAVGRVLDVCSTLHDGAPIDDAVRASIHARQAAWSREGLRAIAVASRELDAQPAYGRDAERDLTLLGFVTFLDRPKEGAREAIQALSELGVAVKVITGDAELVARHVAGLVGLSDRRVLTGAQLDELHDEALWREAERTDLFVEVDPNQKERIILSLKKMGHVVGFLGDGVNDAPAMHAADTSISVEAAADVAREAADFVLLERHLDVIRRGIEEGRKTFANTLKYVLTTTSANLGNMVSMAVASLFLPFLPLLAGQVLLNNFLSDIPALGIASDAVDPEMVDRPRRWDMKFIRRFMIEFGLLSSVFDLLTFAGLLHVFHATEALFRTGWFVESLLTELVIALVVRTRRPFWSSRPGNLLLGSTIALVIVTFAVPYLPHADVLGFVPAPPALLLALAAAAVLYVAAAEALKRWFYRGVV